MVFYFGEVLIRNMLMKYWKYNKELYELFEIVLTYAILNHFSKKCETLDIYDMYKKDLCIFMDKYHNSLLSSAFDSLFTNLGSSHSFNTRNVDNYRFEIHKIRNAISDGPKVWNSIPNELKKCKHINQFKKKMRKYLQNQIYCFSM